MSISLPKAIEDRYTKSVETAAWRVTRRWGSLFDLEELLSEAWIIAAERWQEWEKQRSPEGYAVTDTTQRLSNRVRAMLRAEGWSETKDGWRKTEHAVSPQAILDHQADESTEVHEPTAYVTSYAYEPATPWDRIEFLRILEVFHPDTYAALVKLASEKPSTLSRREHERRMGARRAKFHAQHWQALCDAYMASTKGSSATRDDMVALLSKVLAA